MSRQLGREGREIPLWRAEKPAYKIQQALNTGVGHLPNLQTLLNSDLGQRFKLLAHWALGFVLTNVGMVILPGRQRLNPSKPTALVVSHEASITGAPILALNLCQQLSASHNVVVLLLGGGILQGQFRECSTALVLARLSFVNRKLVRRSLKRATKGQAVQFALVNSVVSAPLLEPLRSEGIACLCLVHEFVAYVKPLDIFSELGIWASRVVCSTPLTWNDVLRHCSHLADVHVSILPQGQCQLPTTTQSQTSSATTSPLPPERDPEHFLAQLPADTLLVLGAGFLQPRKGVDLFIAVAQQIRLQAPDLPVQFAWIGSGYKPDSDFIVSVWLKDQIERSELTDRLTMLEESSAYKNLIDRSDLFVVSSRLDPLPNVAIDAMLSGTPVLCFSKACGIADLLEEQPNLYNSCVAPYLDCTAMAKKAMALLRSPHLLQQLGQQTQEHAKRWFNMPHYVSQLIDLARNSAADVCDEDEDIHLLLQQRLIKRDFHCSDSNISDLAMTQRYVLAWRSNIRAAKPFPGFHPGIYREQRLPAESRRDPLAHWHRHGQPRGLWNVNVIEPSTTSGPVPENSQVALHIHIFYPELLSQILERLCLNNIRPDLYLSYSQCELEPAIQLALAKHGLEASLHLVPNRGRDIGPLVSELGLHLDQHYAFHGHLHTKKSVLIAGATAARWREFLLVNLLGESGTPMADRILAAMESNPEIGLVFPDDPGCIGWTENRSHGESLANRLGLPALPESINFPVGTMFWARQGALSQLYGLGLSWDDYPPEPLGYDGTMLHAIERLLPQVCLASGHGYAVTHVPGFSR